MVNINKACQLPMYGSGLYSNRYRSAYDDSDRRQTVRSPGDSWTYTPSPWAVRPSVVTNTSTGSVVKTHLSNSSLNKPLVDDYSMANSSHTNTPARRTRYSRSSTTSVAQLLSDSCSSLLQKLTTRVRGPSATVERQLITNNSSSRGHPNPLSTSKSSTVVPNFGMTRSRIEDKYANVLDRIYRRKDPEKTIEPSMGRNPLSKSSTTTNMILSEKAYPYVSNVSQREKTPFKNDNRTSVHRRQFPEPQYTYLDGDSSYRIRHRSNHSELRPRRSSKPHRTGKSEVNDRKPITTMKLCPVEIKLNEDPVPVHLIPPESSLDSPKNNEATSSNSIPDPVSDREAKRKEIQSLIMKYSALDEAYNKVKPDSSSSGTTSASTKVNVPSASSATSVTASIIQKYYPNIFAAVSNKSRVV